jgi:hypothetical protein
MFVRKGLLEQAEPELDAQHATYGLVYGFDTNQVLVNSLRQIIKRAAPQRHVDTGVQGHAAAFVKASDRFSRPTVYRQDGQLSTGAAVGQDKAVKAQLFSQHLGHQETAGIAKYPIDAV